MKIIKFYSIKLFILLLVNLIVFTVSFILLQILKQIENTELAYMINSFVSSVIYWIYTFKASKNYKNPSGLTQLRFTLREMSVYFILIVIVVISSFIVNEITKLIFVFFLPNSFFFYLTKSSWFGGLLHLVWYGIIVYISRFNAQRGSKI